MGDDGFLLQQRLLTELCKLRNLPDSGVPDKDAGLEALRRLKVAAHEHDLGVEKERTTAKRGMARSARKRAFPLIGGRAG